MSKTKNPESNDSPKLHISPRTIITEVDLSSGKEHSADSRTMGRGRNAFIKSVGGGYCKWS
jgi:hypothetical protein